jgi:hypothetical protein
VNKPYSQTIKVPAGCFWNCGCLLQHQLINQLESLTVLIPPETTRPERGSLFVISLILLITAGFLTYTDADSHLVSGICEQNFSGQPNSDDCFAMFFHISQLGATGLSLRIAGCEWSPNDEFSVQLPFVMKIKSPFKSIDVFLPFRINSRDLAVFCESVILKITLVALAS